MNIKKILLFGTLLTFALSLKVTGDVDLSKVVRSIEVKGALQTGPIIAKKLGEFTLKPGRRIDESSLVKDMNKLYLAGFYSDVSSETRPSGNQVILTYRVKENPIIKSIRVIGNKSIDTGTLLNQLLNKKKRVFNIQYMKEEKRKIRDLYFRQGYSLFQFEEVFLSKKKELVLKLSEGKVDEIRFEGLENINHFIVERELKSRKGTVFNEFNVKEDRNILLNSGYFSDVSSPVFEESSEGKNVVIVFEIKEKKVNTIDFGLETEREQIFGFLKGVRNHLLFQSDLLIGKIQVGSEAGAGIDIKSYSARYSQPWALNIFPTSLNLDIWDEIRRERLSDKSRTTLFENRRFGGAASIGIPLIKDRFKLSLRGKSERVKFTDGATPDNAKVSDYKLRSISSILSYTSLTNQFNPSKGSYWSLEYERGGELGFINVGGIDFSRWSINGATFIKTPFKTIFAIRGFVGVFRPDADIDFLTFETEGYDIGGANSMRGYKEFHEIGSREALLNIELRHPFSEGLQGVLFYDLGHIFEDGLPLPPTGYTKGLGFGLRYFTPLGPLRVDLGWPQTEFLQYGSTIIHFGIGQMF
jgi:outer membrane protein insertion porin family